MGGNMKTVDLLYSKATNKQFITVQTRKGETYYLVIDYDKPLDKDGEPSTKPISSTLWMTATFSAW